MHLVCSYCGRYIQEKQPFDNTKLTHGICLDCYVPTSILTSGFSYDEYLETFDVSVMIVNFHHTILAANQQAQAMLGKPLNILLGMRNGDALDCPYAKLPEGCGKTIHCETCTIRNLLLKTMEWRISLHNEPVSVETKDGKKDFLLSAIFYDDLIQIIFDDCWIVPVDQCELV